MDPMEADDMANFDVEVHAPLIASQGFAEEISCTSYMNVTFEMDDLGGVVKVSIF